MRTKPLVLSMTLFLASLAVATCSAAEDSSDTPPRPNVVVILVDDMGYSDLGCYGGEIETPNIDRLAMDGLRMTQFYNQGRCCPTRASLMTGLQPHQVGIGHMTAPPGKPLGITGPYQGYLNRDCTTIASVLKDAGYRTLMTGKWHLSSDNRDGWPLQRGFDYFYGCISGAINYFQPGGDRGLTEGNDAIEVPQDFYATDTFTQKAIEAIGDGNDDGKSPFFLYLAYNAPHWPLNAKWEDYQKYRGRYRSGWRDLMTQRNRRQIEMGLLAKDAIPAPHPGPDWDELPPKQRDRLDSVMAAYAGCLDSVDQNVGRLVRHLESIGQIDNTLILFLSDNGACQEGGKFGKGDEAMVRNPPLQTVDGVRLGLNWAAACSTPYRKFKHYVHEGGACTPMIVHWPEAIKTERRGQLIHGHAYLQDILPTLMELAGGDYPTDLPPLPGRSMVPLIDASETQIHGQPLFWEHEGNAAVRDGQWKLVREYEQPWELFDLSKDRTEMNDLADAMPQRRDAMIDQWERWATEHGVAFPKRFNMYEYLSQRQRQKSK